MKYVQRRDAMSRRTPQKNALVCHGGIVVNVLGHISLDPETVRYLGYGSGLLRYGPDPP